MEPMTAVLAVLSAAVASLATAAAMSRRTARARRDLDALRLEAETAKREAERLAEVDRVREESVVQRLAEKERSCGQRLADKDAELQRRERACQEMLAEKTADCQRALREKTEETERLIRESRQSLDATMKALEQQFVVLAVQRLKDSSQELSAVSQQRMDAVVRPFREEMERLRKAFEENRQQQVQNVASFDRAIKDLGDRTLQIGRDADNLAKALKSESKTQGDWGELVLTNVLTAAGMKKGVDFVAQAQEVDADGNRIIPDVEIALPDGAKLLVDSKTSVTAYLDYVAAQDKAAQAEAAKRHVASVRKHMMELADKEYIKRVKGSQGYILMFIPNEGSYLLAMESDRALATDAFKRHVIIVNPTTLLLCLRIVMLLRTNEAQNENAQKIIESATKLYDKFAAFSATFVEMGKHVGQLSAGYAKANGQLCEGNGNVVRQLERFKEMGVVTSKSINPKLLDGATCQEGDA